MKSRVRPSFTYTAENTLLPAGAHGTPSSSASTFAEATRLCDGTLVWSSWIVIDGLLRSEHRIRVRRRRWHRLQHVPVLDDLAGAVEAEDVDAGPVAVRIGRPHLVAVQHDEIAFGERALDAHALARVLVRHALEVRDERVLAVG